MKFDLVMVATMATACCILPCSLVGVSEESDASVLGFLIYPVIEVENLQNTGTYLHGFIAQNRADIMLVADI